MFCIPLSGIFLLAASTQSPRSNSAVPLYSKGQLVVFKAALADSLPDHLAEDGNDNDNDEENDDGEEWHLSLIVGIFGCMRVFCLTGSHFLNVRVLFMFLCLLLRAYWKEKPALATACPNDGV